MWLRQKLFCMQGVSATNLAKIHKLFWDILLTEIDYTETGNQIRSTDNGGG